MALTGHGFMLPILNNFRANITNFDCGIVFDFWELSHSQKFVTFNSVHKTMTRTQTQAGLVKDV